MKNCLAIFIVFIGLMFGCEEKPSKNLPAETPTSGTIYISVDESFKPVISEQIKVFQSSYPNANIIAEYKAEAECLRDLQRDSTRMIIVSRELTREEILYYRSKLEYDPSFALVANDAIAVVVNKNNPDSAFTMNDIKAILSGKGPKTYNVVVDGKTATSTVRYLIDSVLRGNPLGKNVTAAKSSADVISYVANSNDAIGFVGLSWMLNPTDAKQEAVLNQVRTGSIECKSCEKNTYAKPSQQTIVFRQYPLVRGLYYVLKENFTGLGTGFLNFLIHERGQLIFRRADLAPAQMNFYRRRTKIDESQ